MGGELGIQITEVNTALFIILGIMSLLIICSNLFVIILIGKNGSLRDVTGCFMASLSMADLGVGLSLLLPLIYMLFSEYMNMVICNMIGFINSVTWVVSVYCMMLLSLDRCINIVYPYKYSKLASTKIFVFAILVVWVFSALLWIFPLVGIGSFKFNEEEVTCYFDVAAFPTQWILYNGVIFGPTSITIMVSYTRIWMVTLKHRKQIRSENTLGNMETLKNRKALYTLSLIVGAFYFAWMPFVVEHIVKAIQGSLENVPEWLEIGIYILAASNSFWNPIIYISTNKRFRYKSAELLCGLCPGLKWKLTPMENELFTVNTKNRQDC